MIEQRIGRLDRLERDPSRPIVHSVVIYTLETFEEALFNFWNEGLKIFTQSLNASDQTIILSTDTEIDQNYYEMMKNSVGDEFTLVYSEETKSTSIKKGYFQEL